MYQALNMVPGQPLLDGVYGLTEGIHYNYSTYGHTLVVSLARPGKEDIRAVNHGDNAFALVVRENIVFLLAKIGGRAWKASHYNWWLNPPHLRPDTFADLHTGNNALALQTCLADARTGLVAAVRTFKLSTDFGKALLETVAGQIRNGLDPWRQLGVARELLDRSPDQDWMLDEAVCVQLYQADVQAGPADKETEPARTPKRRCAALH